MHCHHGAANCPDTTVQVIFAECPPSNLKEHCCRTRRSRSGLRGQIHGAQSLERRKNDEHALGRTAALSHHLWSWESWALPLRRLLFSIGIVPIDPNLVPSNDPRHEGWVIHGTLTKLLTNCNTVLFLFGGQKPGYELCSNAVQFKSNVRIVCTVPYDTLTIVAKSLMVLRRSSCTCTFLGIELVEGRPDLSSSLSDVVPVLNRACHSKHLARLMASFLYARHII